MPDVVTAAGDCFCRVAKSNGFYNYRTVYDHADNATNFPNPNQVEEGSTIKVPEKKMKTFDLPLDAEKKFKIVRKKTKLAISLCKADSTQAPTIASAKLTIGGKKAASAAATVEIDDIDAAETTASLVVVLAKPAPYAAAPATSPAVANQHPPAIVAADFDDPATIWPKAGETITWNLNVGSLEPHTVTRGVLQRLVNLGFTCPVAKAEDDESRRAVRSYRRSAEAKVAPADTDAVADIRGHIKTRHDD